MLPLIDIGPLLTDETATAVPTLTTELAPSTHPLALLPVRLETRFTTTPVGATELRVRIYPDKIHLDAHDPRLTAEEVLAGQTYWERQWRGGDDEAALRAAWQQLAGRFEPGRAAWIARALTPVNPAERSPNGRPQLPDPGEPAEIARTPLARLLPRRWTATAYRAGQVLAVATGAEVRAELNVGPDLTEPAPDDPAQAAVDAGMRWMIDADEAEAAGMALRVPLPDASGVDLLLVTGATGLDPADGAERFAGLLDAHHFADGLAFVPPGTPSNNAGGERAGYASRDQRGTRSFAVEARPVTVAPGSAADRAAGALGVPVSTVTVEGHADGDAGVAAAMTTALWPATWGYYLTQFGGVAPDDVDWARTHARRNLRPGGLLPTLRCGRQPYGLLPVTTLGRFRGNPTIEDDGSRLERLAGLITRLREEIWRPVLPGVARVGRGDDPNGEVLDVLRTDAVSTAVQVRALMGPHYLRNLRGFLGENLDGLGFWGALLAITGPLARRVGLVPLPPASRLVFEGGSHPLTTALVEPTGYLAELLAVSDPEPLARPVPAEPVPLLHALLRHGLLREYAGAAARLLAGSPAERARLLTDAELVDLVPHQPPSTSWSWQRTQPVPGSAPPVTVADAISAAADAGSLGEFRAALADLATAAPADLERHLMQTLDATSHRLDAWAGSVAAQRLAEVRDAQPAGLLVGGYGWVEGLLPDQRTLVPVLPAGEPGPLFAGDDDPGFVHAPSLGQASTAALLRNAHLAHGGTRTSPYAMQLTSERVRTARRLFDGVRQGQPLGALLGYDVERRLQSARLADLIDDLRELAPRPGEAGPDARARRLLLDGRELHRLWTDDPDGLLDRLPLHHPGLGDRRGRLAAVLHSLDAAVDATADAITAESVHQLVRGNLTRSAPSLDAIAGGDAAPPGLEFMNTPRTGTAVTHRVGVLLDATTGPTGGWSGDSPRARAEPVLNAWAGRLLGPATGELTGRAPLDVLADEPGALAEPPAGLLTVTAALRALIAGARPLDDADLRAPHADLAAGVDLDEFEARAAAAQAELAAVGPAGAAARFGISVPPTPPGTDGAPDPRAAELIAGAVQAEIRRRLADAEAAAAAPPGEPEPARRDRIQRRFAAVFGPGFVALPRFRCDPADRAGLAASLADPDLTAGDPLAVDTWLLRMERLRPGVARLGAALRPARVLAEAVTITDEPLVELAQVPHTPGQCWVGLPFADTPLCEGVASIALNGVPTDLSGPLAGLLVEEWTEIVPRVTETTGLAFRYDPPDAMAPQAILLAVPPVPGESWTTGTLNQVLLETLDLAHLRAVGPAALGDAGQYLPAAVLAFNADGDAVATDLSPLTS